MLMDHMKSITESQIAEVKNIASAIREQMSEQALERLLAVHIGSKFTYGASSKKSERYSQQSSRSGNALSNFFIHGISPQMNKSDIERALSSEGIENFTIRIARSPEGGNRSFGFVESEDKESVRILKSLTSFDVNGIELSIKPSASS